MFSLFESSSEATRRDFLRIGTLGLGGLTLSQLLGARAAATGAAVAEKSVIFLFQHGGPSQFETFDPKPGHANGGETKAIDTSVAGIQIADNLPQLAKVADDLAIVRSLTTKEGNHPRATFLLHTAHVPTASVHYPTLGSVVSRELGGAGSELPSFVRIGPRFRSAGEGGLLGADYNPFLVPNPDRLPENVQPLTAADRYQRRLGLLGSLELAADAAATPEVAEHRGLYQKAAKMVLSPQMDAFNLDREPSAMREAYGKSNFGAGCLLARRLVEAGVTFVEVGLGNWDTHFDNFTRSRGLAGELDRPFAQLVADLKSRGMLDKTLVIWMGEFGRTPRINPRGGRDHFPRAFSAVLAGGGVRGGQVLGATENGGEAVKDRPVTEKDLFRTVYQALGVDSRKEFMSPIGRPIKPVDGGSPIAELLS